MERVALLVGINDCKCKQPGTNLPLDPLQYAENDPRLLRARLSQLGFYIPDNALLTGDTATVPNVQAAIETLCRTSPALFIFFFAGHGGTDDDGFQTLCFKQAEVSGHLRIADIRRQVLDHKVRQFLIIVDACRRPAGAGWSARGGESSFRGNGKLFETSGSGTQSAAFFGSKYGQVCWEDPSLKNGVFTWALAEALDNWPPTDDLSLPQLRQRVALLMAGALGRPGQEREQMPFLIPSGSTISLTNLAGYSSIPPRGLQVSEAVRYLAAGRNSYLLLTSKGRLFCSHKGEPWEKLHTHGPVVAAAISPHTGAIVCLARLPDGLWLLEMDQAGRMHRRLRQMGADRWGLCFDDADTLAVYGEDLIYFDSSQWDHYEHVSGIANIRNGSFFRSSLLALTRESVLICDLETHQHQILMRDSSVPSQHVAASSSDNWTASWAAWSNWHKVFIHSENGIEVAEMPVAAPVTSLSFTPDEDFLAVGTAAGDVYLRQRSSQARPSLIMQQAEGIVSALSFTHDGSHMLIGTSRGRLEVSSMRLGNRSQAAGVTP